MNHKSSLIKLIISRGLLIPVSMLQSETPLNTQETVVENKKHLLSYIYSPINQKFSPKEIKVFFCLSLIFQVFFFVLIRKKNNRSRPQYQVLFFKVLFFVIFSILWGVFSITRVNVMKGSYQSSKYINLIGIINAPLSILFVIPGHFFSVNEGFKDREYLITVFIIGFLYEIYFFVVLGDKKRNLPILISDIITFVCLSLKVAFSNEKDVWNDPSFFQRMIGFFGR